MLSTVTRIGRCSKLLRCSLINCRKNPFYNQSECSWRKLSRGYVTLNSRAKYLNKYNNECCQVTLAQYSSSNHPPETASIELNSVEFEKISDDTLDSLTEYFDEIIEEADHLTDADVAYGDGVLTVKFGDNYGTYVINRQSPNKQIWLSSPTSGPKRYDFIDGTWIYKHDGKSLHELLDEEIPRLVNKSTSFQKCSYSKRIK